MVRTKPAPKKESSQRRPPARRGRRPRGGTDAVADTTRAKIISVAENLFAEFGVDGVSLRTIMASAGVSLCLINYHFTNKEGLLRAIFEKRAVPLNRERIAMIEAAGPTPKLEDLLRAFFMPGLRAGLAKHGQPDNFDRLLGRIGSDPSDAARAMIREYFDDFQRLFIIALRKAVPHLSAEDAYWRLHCLLGVVMYTATNPHRIYELSGGLCDIGDVNKAFEKMLPILLAAIGASSAPAVSLSQTPNA
jgi:AcrR family transcriptional regulator